MSLKDAYGARALIEAHSIPIPFTGCWMWLRSFHNGGYGQQWFGVGPDRRLFLVHRLSYEAFKGPIPAGMLIQHSCDNRWCCNPEHLSLGTDATNARDALLKGRTHRKLVPDDVREIRRRTAAGESVRALSREYGVSQFMIARIRDRKSWALIRDNTAADKYRLDSAVLAAKLARDALADVGGDTVDALAVLSTAMHIVATSRHSRADAAELLRAVAASLTNTARLVETGPARPATETV